MSGAVQATEELAVVAIGRNEGERLERCLRSCAGNALVYVDSGSTDGSPELARALGASVVELDRATPFSAARARNEGLARAAELFAQLRFVQFVDGDCELDAGWLAAALPVIAESDDVVAVCGRRRERRPDDSPYNRLCDMEWDTPLGEASACGGDVLMRVEALTAVGGYATDLIAGEDPELSLRLRRAGGRILRLDHEMTLHDADMHTFGQWWRRTRRAGHAYAECWDRHRAEAYRQRELGSLLVWGLVLPLTLAVASVSLGGASLLGIGVYGVLFERVRRFRIGRGDHGAHARIYALATVVGKWPQAIGALEYAWNRVRRTRSAIIEYRAP